MDSFQWRGPSLTIVLATTLGLCALRTLFKKSSRYSVVPRNEERVLILGASGGIGRVIAHLYAARGASVCVVARRKQQLDQVVKECKACANLDEDSKKFFGIVADFASVDDMVRVRNDIATEFQGLDTVIIAAGVSSLRPLLAVAGVDIEKNSALDAADATSAGIQRVVDVAGSANTGNCEGPLVAAVTLIPILCRSSRSPSILLLSSLAAVIPAPTRALYAATKSYSLLLYQALAIEHPQISFSFILPSTVEGNFRASAVDGGPVRETAPNKTGLKTLTVAERCVRAVDEREKTVFLPGYMRLGHILYWLWPALIESMARTKYNF